MSPPFKNNSGNKYYLHDLVRSSLLLLFECPYAVIYMNYAFGSSRDHNGAWHMCQAPLRIRAEADEGWNAGDWSQPVPAEEFVARENASLFPI